MRRDHFFVNDAPGAVAHNSAVSGQELSATACPVPLRVATCTVIQLSKISAADPHGIDGTASQEHEFLNLLKNTVLLECCKKKPYSASDFFYTEAGEEAERERGEERVNFEENLCALLL